MSTKQAPVVMDPKSFALTTKNIAVKILSEWVGEARAQEAIGRIATAINTSAASAKNPADFYACTPASIGKVVAISALTGIMVGTGQGALAYAIPRRPRKNEPPQLQFQLSHRGVAALAKRAGFSLVAHPIHVNDVLSMDENSEVQVVKRDFDNPPMTEADLRGVLVVVKSIATGVCVAKGFVAKSLINQRRDKSDSYRYAELSKDSWAKDNSTWHQWYVEMAMKTAMHYAINRGWCVVDDTEAVRALSVDSEGDVAPQEQPQGADKSRTEELTDRLLGFDPEAVSMDAGDVVEGEKVGVENDR